MKIKLSILICLYTVLAPLYSQNNKGIWLTDVASDALDSKEGIEEVVSLCERIKIENIFVVVWNRGYTLYPSDIMSNTFDRKVSPRFQDRDILQELIEAAHKRGLKVHAWFEFGFSSSYEESDGGYILRSKPEWKAIDNEGKLVTKNGFQWMNAFDPNVQDFLLSLILEVVKNYDIDGIQGDDRLPANPSTAGYDNYTISLYQSEHNGNSPPKNFKDSLWVDWRAKKLNTFVERIYKAVKNEDPNIHVSMAPSIYPWSKVEYLQDWPTWVREGWVDEIIPQVYRYDIKSYTSTLHANLEFMPNESEIPFTPGVLLKVGDYSPSPRFLRKMVKANRKMGLKGEVFFFYEGLNDHAKFFRDKYREIK